MPRGAYDARPYAPAIACSALLAIALIAFHFVGVSGRRYVDGHHRYDVAGSREGYLLLCRLGVRGRVVVLFDRTAHILRPGTSEFIRSRRERDESAPVTPENLMEGLIFSDIVRRVYVVVPGSVWPTVEHAMVTRGDTIVTSESATSRLCGVPVIYVTPENLPRFDEKVIVYLQGSVASEYPVSMLTSFDDPKVSDVYIVQEGR